MYVCMYVRMYVCTYVCMYACMYVYTYIYIYSPLQHTSCLFTALGARWIVGQAVMKIIMDMYVCVSSPGT